MTAWTCCIGWFCFTVPDTNVDDEGKSAGLENWVSKLGY